MNALNEDMFLRIANELYLKRLVVGNMGPVFEFSRDFRNEGMDRTHNPEFTQVELYKPYADYNWMMNMAEKVFERIAVDLHGTTQVKFGDHTIDLKTPWRRLTVYDGLRESYGIEPTELTDEQVRELGRQMELPEKHKQRGDILMALFEKKYDNELIHPTFVFDYPKSTSALTKQHRDSPELVERFECFVAGLEVMNSYTELNDPRDQRARFEEQRLKRLAGDDEAMPTDEDFLVAMEYGMPPMGGLGIGVDRMAMILTNTTHIRDIILFPPVTKESK
jgi:lysyl-tRNA synthetase class 2